MAKCKVLDFKFINKPIFRERTPLEGMPKKQLLSIAALPFRLVRNCIFTFTLRVDKKEYEFKATVPKGFCYNMADIPLLLQPISYKDTSPFVKNASFVHDYLLNRRVELYKTWEMKELGITPSNFRDITSEIFGLVLKQSAVSNVKANIMAFAVNVFQTILFLDWAKCGKDTEVKEREKF